MSAHKHQATAKQKKYQYNRQPDERHHRHDMDILFFFSCITLYWKSKTEFLTQSRIPHACLFSVLCFLNFYVSLVSPVRRHWLEQDREGEREIVELKRQSKCGKVKTIDRNDKIKTMPDDCELFWAKNKTCVRRQLLSNISGEETNKSRGWKIEFRNKWIITTFITRNAPAFVSKQSARRGFRAIIKVFTAVIWLSAVGARSHTI